MLEYVHDGLRSYIYSDYRVDDRKQGFLVFDPHANLGRVTSLVDVTAQVGKGIFGSAASSAFSVGRIGAGAGSLLIVIPSSFAWGVARLTGCRCADFFKEKTVSFLQFGLENLLRGLFTLCIGIPLSLIWRVFMCAADILGILLPEIGRWARNLNKILNAALANLNETCTRQKEKRERHAESAARSGPHYRHNFKPQADLVGGLTAQKALEILGLKQGASLAEVKKAAHRLYRQHHPDRGGNSEAFREVRDADLFLREKLRSEPPRSWNFGKHSTTHSNPQFLIV